MSDKWTIRRNPETLLDMLASTKSYTVTDYNGNEKQVLLNSYDEEDAVGREIARGHFYKGSKGFL